ncbi:MAG: cysteine hydrolase [Clostridia bacterium]|nr:cysteine hydrolase [Clostridia bacterium]
MFNIKREDFIKRSTETLNAILDMLEDLAAVNLKELKVENTVLIMVDMINGFTREGALQSPRVEALIPEITRLSRVCGEQGIGKLAFADCHTQVSPEFGAYPVHCLAGTREGEVVDELKAVGGYELIEKNSTNGFLEEKFQEWLKANPQIDNFIVVGDCTDICVQQFAITLKTYYNIVNKNVRVIVPVNAVDTYDFAIHNGDLMQVMALYNMMGNGIEVVKGIED